MARGLLQRMFVPADGVALDGLGVFGVPTAVAVWWSMIGPNAFDIDAAAPEPRPRGRLVLAAALGACVAIIAGNPSSPFLYFQF